MFTAVDQKSVIFKSVEKNTAAFIISLLIVCTVFYSFFFQSTEIIVLSFFVLLAFSIIIAVREKKIERNRFAFIVFLTSLLAPGLFKLDHGMSNLFYLLLEVMLLYISGYVIKNPYAYYKAIRLTLYSFILIVFVGIYLFIDYDEPLSYLVSGSSQNGIPSYLLILLISYLFCSLFLENKLPILPSILTVVVSFYGEGRGSMIVSLFIVALCFSHAIWDGGKVKRLKFVRFLPVMVLVFLAIYYESIIEFMVTGTKLSVGLSDFHRVNIFQSYIDSLGSIDILVGKGYSGTIIDTEYNGNPHISYIRLHSFFGILPVLFVLLTPFLVFSKGISRRNIYLFLLLSAALLRAFTEPVLFPTNLDFFYISSIMLLFMKESRLCKIYLNKYILNETIKK